MSIWMAPGTYIRQIGVFVKGIMIPINRYSKSLGHGPEKKLRGSVTDGYL
jgi:hypothetical protein